MEQAEALTLQPGQLVRYFLNGWRYARLIETDGRTVTVKHYRKLKRKKTITMSVDIVEVVEEAGVVNA